MIVSRGGSRSEEAGERSSRTRQVVETRDPRCWTAGEVEFYLEILFAEDDQQRKSERRLNIRHAAVSGDFLVGTVVKDDALMSSELHLTRLQRQRLVADLQEKVSKADNHTSPQAVRSIMKSPYIQTPGTPEMQEMKQRLTQLELILQMTGTKSPKKKRDGTTTSFLQRLAEAEEHVSTADAFIVDSTQATPEKRRADVHSVRRNSGSSSPGGGDDDMFGNNDELEEKLRRIKQMKASRMVLTARHFEDEDSQSNSSSSHRRQPHTAPRAAQRNDFEKDARSIWLVGGWDGYGVVASVERYNGSGRQWASGNALISERRGASVAATDDAVLVFGGWTGREHTRTCEVLDLSRSGFPDSAEPHWAPLPPLPHPTSEAAAVLSGSECLVLGGCTSTPNPRVQILQLPWRVWEEGPPMGTCRSRLAAVAVGGVIYAIGGTDGKHVLSSVEMLDTTCPSLGWRRAGSLSCPREGHAAVVLGHRIFVLGGFDGCKHLSSVEAFDVNGGGSWRVVTCMQAPRSEFAAVVLGQSIVAIGGTTRGSSHQRLASVEVWRPGSVPTDRWRYINGLRGPRSACAAAVA